MKTTVPRCDISGVNQWPLVFPCLKHQWRTPTTLRSLRITWPILEALRIQVPYTSTKWLWSAARYQPFQRATIFSITHQTTYPFIHHLPIISPSFPHQLNQFHVRFPIFPGQQLAPCPRPSCWCGSIARSSASETPKKSPSKCSMPATGGAVGGSLGKERLKHVENLQETIDFPIKIMGLSCRFSLTPIHWTIVRSKGLGLDGIGWFGNRLYNRSTNNLSIASHLMLI